MFGRRYFLITEDRLLLIRIDVFLDIFFFGIGICKIRINIYNISFIDLYRVKFGSI